MARNPGLRPLPTLPENRKAQEDRRGPQEMHALPDRRTKPGGRRVNGKKPSFYSSADERDPTTEELKASEQRFRRRVIVPLPPDEKKKIPKPRAVPPPGDRRTGEDRYHERRQGDRREPPKRGGTLKTDSFNPWQSPHDRAVEDTIFGPQERKDRQWEQDQLDKDVKDSPNVEDFLGKMKDKAREQERGRKRREQLDDASKPVPKPKPPYNKPPLPDLPGPGEGGPPRRNNSKPLPLAPQKRMPIPKRPNGTPPTKRVPIPPQKPIPPAKRPNGTPPFKPGELGGIRILKKP